MEIGRFQPAFIMLAAVAGIGIGSVVSFGDASSAMVEIPLMALLFLLFLGVDLRNVGRSLTNVRFSGTALALNFVLTPILACILGLVFFSGEMDLRIGLIMLLATPCTDWYLVFTGMSRGNVELGMSILPLNLVLQILLMPVYLAVFIGSDIGIDMADLLISMSIVLVIPLALAILVKHLVGKERLEPAMDGRKDDLQLLLLCIAVMMMFASEGQALLDNISLLVEMFLPLTIFFGLLLAVSQAAGRMMGFGYGDRTALSFTSLARNSPLSLAIAVAAFPAQPLISLSLVIGPLIELPILSLISWGLLRTKDAPRSTERRSQ